MTKTRSLKLEELTKNTHRVEYLLISLFAVVIGLIISIRWYGGWYYIHQVDALFYLNPNKLVYSSNYAWKDDYSLGFSSFNYNQIPLYLTQEFLLNLFFSLTGDHWKSLVLSQFIIIYLLVFLSFLFSYLFFREMYKFFFKGGPLDANDIIILVLVSMFYVINLHTVTIVFWRFLGWSFFWPAYPLLSYLLVKFLLGNNYPIKYVLYSAFIFVTPLGAGFSQLFFFLLFITWFIILLMILAYARQKVRVIRIVKKFAMFIALFMLLVSWILIPQVYSIFSGKLYEFASWANPRLQLEYVSQFTTLLNVIRLLGINAFYTSAQSPQKYPYSWANQWIENKVIVCASFIYPLIVMMSLLLISNEKKKEIKRLVLWIVLVSLFVILVMKGAADPFRDLGYILLSINKTAFRRPYIRFVWIYLFLWCFILLYTLYRLANRGYFKKHRTFYISSLALILLINTLINYPFFTGDLIHPSDKIDLSKTQYLGLKEHTLNISSEYRTLVYPFSIYGEVSYNISNIINHANFKPPLSYAFIPNLRIINIGYSYSEKIALKMMCELIKDKKYEELIGYLKILNVRYIVLQKDFSLKYNNPKTICYDYTFIKDLENKSFITKIFENNNINIYEVHSSQPFSAGFKIANGLIYSNELNHLKKFHFNISEFVILDQKIPLLPENLYVLSSDQLRFNVPMLKVTIKTNNYLPEKSWAFVELSSTKWKYAWQTDYRNGILFTWAENATTLAPFKVNNSSNYKLFISYFKSQEGGTIRIYIDGMSLTINTTSQLNYFVWKELGTFYLERGEHEIVLENVNGFNAVNFFVLIPEKEYLKAEKEVEKLLQNKTIIYVFEAESDLYRSNAEIIRDINANNGEMLIFSENSKAWQKMEIVKNSTYKIALKGVGTFNVSIGNYSYVLTLNNLTFKYTPMFYLRNGEYKLKIIPLSKDAILDVVWLYSTNNNETLEELFQVKETPAQVQSYTKINPTLWKVKVNATKPFFLTFAESYDPLWEARVYKDGKLVEKVSPVPVYGVINGFWINQTGELEIILRYTPQDWFERGLIISLTTFILSIFYIFYDWRREKGDRWAKRLEKKFRKIGDRIRDMSVKSS